MALSDYMVTIRGFAYGSDGTPVKSPITFSPRVPRVVLETGEAFSSPTVTIPDPTTGEILVQLLATSVGTPRGWTYNVRYAGGSWDVMVPWSEEEIQFGDLIEVQPARGSGSTWASRNDVLHFEQRLSAVEASSDGGGTGGEGGGLPPNGSVGQYIRKSSSLEGDAAWQTIQISEVGGLTTALGEKTSNTDPRLSDARVSPDNTVTEAQMVQAVRDKLNRVLTKADVGLPRVANTNDAEKPISTATQAALNLKADLVSGVIPTSQIPSVALNEFLGEVANQTGMIATTAQKGDTVYRQDTKTNWICVGDSTLTSGWREFSSPVGGVSSVNGQQGTVILGKGDVGLPLADNTPDLEKPVSNPTQTALNLKSNLTDPRFTDQRVSPDNSVTEAQLIQALRDKVNAPDDVTSVSGKTGDVVLDKGDVGLGLADNTPDQQKPVSDPVALALQGKVDTTDLRLTDERVPQDNSVTEAKLSPQVLDKLNDGGGVGSPSGVSSVNTRTGDVVLTKTDVGLDQADNTSDLDKPLSTAAIEAFQGKIDSTDARLTDKRVSPDGSVTQAQLDPALATTISNKIDSADSRLSDQRVPLDTSVTEVKLSVEVQQKLNAGGVSSVNTRTGDVVLGKEDVGLSLADNTSDAEKPVSNPTQTALDGKVDNTDIRLSDARTPTDGSVTQAKLETTLSTLISNKVDNTDGRLSDQRTPTDGSVTEVKLSPEVVTKLDGGVQSVNTRTGDIVLDRADVGLDQANNTSDLDKPLSTAALQVIEELQAQITLLQNRSEFLVISSVDDIPPGTRPLSPIIRVQDQIAAPQAGLLSGPGDVTHNALYRSGPSIVLPAGIPSNTAVGDLLVAWVACQSSSTDLVVPTGWTLVLSAAVNNRRIGIAVFSVSTPTALSNVQSQTNNFTGGSGRSVVTVNRVTGVDLDHPVVAVGDPSVEKSSYTLSGYTQPGVGVSDDAGLVAAFSTTNDSFGASPAEIELWTSPSGVEDGGSYIYSAPAGTGQGITGLHLGWKEMAGSPSPDIGVQYNPTSGGPVAAGFCVFRSVNASAQPFVHLEDGFNRTLSGTLGFSDINNVQYLSNGVPAVFGVDPTNGASLTLEPAGVRAYSFLLNRLCKNVEITAEFSFSTVSATGYFEVFARRQSGGSPGYSLYVYRSGSDLLLGAESAYGTLVGSAVTVISGYTPGTLVKARQRITTDGVNTLIEGRIWLSTDPEPSTWQYTSSGTAGPQVDGTIEVRGSLSSSAVGSGTTRIRALKVAEFNG